MKRWLIILGILTVALIAGVWIYIMFNAPSPEEGGLFSNLNFGDTTSDLVPFEERVIEDSVVDIGDGVQLRQLTTRPVVGYGGVIRNGDNPQVYFVEAGTAHIYSIDLVNGQEIRLSNITILGAIAAEISPDGRFTVIQKSDGGKNTTVIEIDGTDGEVISYDLSESTTDFSIQDSVLFYTSIENGKPVAKAYNLENKTTEVLFSVPFYELIMDWGTNINGPHFVYPKPTVGLEGYLYKYQNGIISRMPVAG